MAAAKYRVLFAVDGFICGLMTKVNLCDSESYIFEFLKLNEIYLEPKFKNTVASEGNSCHRRITRRVSENSNQPFFKPTAVTAESFFSFC